MADPLCPAKVFVGTRGGYAGTSSIRKGRAVATSQQGFSAMATTIGTSGLIAQWPWRSRTAGFSTTGCLWLFQKTSEFSRFPCPTNSSLLQAEALPADALGFVSARVHQGGAFHFALRFVSGRSKHNPQPIVSCLQLCPAVCIHRGHLAQMQPM
jgi:hypothetical protein